MARQEEHQNPQATRIQVQKHVHLRHISRIIVATEKKVIIEA